MTSDQPNLPRLIRQHAETSRLLGVDFVPVYRSRDPGGIDPGPDREPEPKPADTAEITRVSAATAAGRIEENDAPMAELEIPVVEVKSPLPGGLLAERTEVKPGRTADRQRSQARLDDLRARYEADAPHKNFVTAHTTIVFGEGDPCARLMFVGEAPGEEEDRTGRPFVGRAGQLLDKMIVAMGLKRQDVYIANVLKTRPPNNATPTLDEARLCAPYLYEQIGIIFPQVIVTLGLPASRTLLGSMETMGKLRGRWAQFAPTGHWTGEPIPVMPTYHPAYLLRNYTPQERGKVWSDLQLVMERLGLGKPSANAGESA